MTAIPKPKSKSKVSRPTRDEFELQELAEKLVTAEQNKEQLLFTIWRRDEIVRGTISKMDPGTQSVHILERAGGLLKVPFIDILEVDEPEI